MGVEAKVLVSILLELLKYFNEKTATYSFA